MTICENCKKEFEKILEQRIKDILAARSEYGDDDDTPSAHCFHLMEVGRIIDGKDVGFGVEAG